MNMLLLRKQINPIIDITVHPNNIVIKIISLIQFNEKRNEKLDERDKNHQIMILST